MAETDALRHLLGLVEYMVRIQYEPVGPKNFNQGFKWRMVVVTDPCSYCPAPGGTLDHIVPRFRNGPNHVGNLTGSCYGCNQRKGKQDVMRFMLRRERRRRERIEWDRGQLGLQALGRQYRERMSA